MKRTLSLAAGAILLLASTSSALAESHVDGCDVLLTPPHDSTFVDVYGPDDVDGFQTFDVIDGVVDLTVNQGMTLAHGHYVAIWEDGTSESFDLVCDDGAPDVDPDYNPSATPAPDPTDEPVVDEPDPTPIATPEPEPEVAIAPTSRPMRFAI